MKFSSIFTSCTLLLSAASAETIQQITGKRFLSPYNGRDVSDVRGLITAKGPNGFWMRATKKDLDPRTSESVYVYGRASLANATVGNIVTVDGHVTEYRSTMDYLYLTEIEDATVTTVSTGNKVTAKVLGTIGLSPPTQQFTSLDRLDVFGIPNNVSQVSNANPLLQPLLFGLDFWESLSGELVTIRSPVALGTPNQYGDTWVAGNWRKTGVNDRGGLTATDRDANPEAIYVIDPLDGSDNPDETKLGDSLQDITGIVQYAFGQYALYPVTALKVTGSQQPATPPPTSLVSSGKCSGLTFGQYNVENLSPKSNTFDDVAGQIVSYLRSPDLLFLQEIQDNDGATDDGVVSANITLSQLVAAISAAGSTVDYDFVDIDPINDQEGGQPGGNIRNAYLYNPAVIRLHKPNPGSSTDATQVLAGPELSYNPGRINPANSAWEDSRIPLAAAWETLDGKNKFFTVNVHWTSKGGSTSLEGDERPPVNLGVDQRQQQADVTGGFVKQILQRDRSASVITAGDFNEFAFVAPMESFQRTSGLKDLDVVAGIPPVERYTYVFGQNSQQLDHMYISPHLMRGAQFEHVHSSSWVSYDDQVSDHDPSVAKLNVCK